MAFLEGGRLRATCVLRAARNACGYVGDFTSAQREARIQRLVQEGPRLLCGHRSSGRGGHQTAAWAGGSPVI